jgi:F-type H+-transporting ATPase subunit gamma
MSRRRDLQQHRNSLAEIRDIMNSMKTLAYMETRKLARFLDAQHTVVNSIEEAATDFLSFHPDLLTESAETQPVYLLIGSERGFCGDFNQRLLEHLDASLESSSTSPLLIVIGHKIHSLMQQDERVSAMLEGASVVEEIFPVLDQLVNALLKLQEQYGKISLYAVYHHTEDAVAIQKLLPPFLQLQQTPPQHTQPPLLNLSSSDFLLDISEQYLLASLHEMLYTSLMAENHQRVIHLNGAINHLDTKSEELAHRANSLRQQEIIEEIEVILLSTTSPETSRKQHEPHQPRE